MATGRNVIVSTYLKLLYRLPCRLKLRSFDSAVCEDGASSVLVKDRIALLIE
jgi:hypothetical protein